MYRKGLTNEKLLRNQRIKRICATFIAGLLIVSLATYGYGNNTAYALSTWAIKLGGPGVEDMFRGIERSSDGGYVFVGETDSFGAGSNDAWIVKLDEDGNVLSQKTYGGSSGDTARVIRQTPDGGYVVAGQTHSFGSGSSDFWLLKFAADGTLQWQKTYGGSRSDIAHALELTSDGGYLVAGFSSSSSTAKDYFVIKLDSGGSIEWQKRYGGSADDVIRFAKQTSDGKYLVAGFTHSFGQDGDIMVLKLGEDGSLEWQKRYGGGKFEEPGSILEVPGGYIILEQTGSFSGGTDGRIFKIDADGTIIWQKRYGGSGFDELSAARLTSDGGFVITGETKSFSLTSEDFWVLKFDSSANLQWQKRYGGDGVDEAEAIALTPEGGYIIAGITYSFGSAGRDIWIIRLDSNGDISQCAPGVHAGIVTDGTVRTTSAVPADTAVVVSDGTALAKNSNAVVKNSNANVSSQCGPSMINTPPVADDDSYSTAKNEFLNVPLPGVLANDTDSDGDILTASLVSGSTNGNLQLNADGGFTYDPDNDFSGTDSFTYRANDGLANSNTATVSIIVSSGNTPPTADSADLLTDVGTELEITLSGTDSEDPIDSLTFYLSSVPQHGGLSAIDGDDLPHLKYTPNAGFVGSDSFTFVIYDTSGEHSNTATISITVS